jgi:RNA polymerase sigma-70 factor (ECF subfamily)
MQETESGATGADGHDGQAERPAIWATVERAQQGDMDAFGELWSTYQSVVFRFLWRRVGQRETAEDLAAETFRRALGRIRTLRWRGSDPGAWFVTIARNLVADYYKSGWARLVVHFDEDPSSTEDAQPSTWVQDAETPAVDNVVAEDLRRAVESLNEHQRTCIELRFLNELSLKETAEKMDMNVGAVKALQGRAVAHLRKALEKRGYEG